MNDLRKRRRGIDAAGLTLAEMLISMGASVLIIGALLLSSMSLQKTLRNSEIYATAYSDQRRLTDYLARDVRRAVGLARTNAAGVRTPISLEPVTVTLADRASLILKLPAYYRSNVAHHAEYDDALEVVGNSERLDYGTKGEGPAPTVEVSFRRIFHGPERSVCFVRQEAGVDEVIVRGASDLSAHVAVEDGAQTIIIKTWFRNSQNKAAKLVSTYDRLLLRNPPLGFKP